jgi:hypothetical protein
MRGSSCARGGDGVGRQLTDRHTHTTASSSASPTITTVPVRPASRNGLPHPGLPLTGFRVNGGPVGAAKSNIASRAPARSSNEWSPMRPVRQLSSMNRSIEV